jgi:hypothetical protein
MFSIAIFGGTKVDGSTVEPGERVVSLALFGGVDLDFASAAPAPAVDLLLIAVFGGVTLRVRPEQEVRISGFSLFGGRTVDPRRLPPPAGATATAGVGDDDFELPLEVAVYSLFGGVHVKRDGGQVSS